MPRVTIDGGHGGYDSGAVGSGLYEKTLTLKVALFLKDMMQADGRFAAQMTRIGDYAPEHLEGNLSAELQARVNIANAFQSDLVISVHFNSATPSANGVEALDYDATGIGRKFANAFCHIVSTQEGLKNRGAKATYNTFAVIRGTSAPAVITESGFISNPEEASHFDTDLELQEIAYYHYLAACVTFDLSPKTELDPRKKEEIVMENDYAGHWAEKNIEKVKVAGIMKGYKDGSFKPNQAITRAEFATALVKALKL